MSRSVSNYCQLVAILFLAVVIWHRERVWRARLAHYETLKRLAGLVRDYYDGRAS